MVRQDEPQDLVTGAEIARRLGISRERVRQLAQRPDFPAPIGRLGQANIWGWTAVDEWRRANGRVPVVEIYSATDPPGISNRQVWYWVEFGEIKSDRSTAYDVARRHAERLSAEHHTAIIDRSDKGSGILRATLGQ
jgi:prophage regulatory protein